MLIITGAAGFIGSNLAVQLASMGYDLWLVDHPLTPVKAMNLVGLQKFTFIEHQEFLRLLDSELPPRAPFPEARQSLPQQSSI